MHFRNSMKYFIYIEALFHIFRCYWGDRSGDGRWLYRGLMRSVFEKMIATEKTRFKLKCVSLNLLFSVTHAVIPLSLTCSHCKSYFPNNIKTNSVENTFI